MKRRLALFALLIIPIFGLFVLARKAASWRPQTLTEKEAYASSTRGYSPPIWTESGSGSMWIGLGCGL